MSESQDRDQDTGDSRMVIDESADTSQEVISDQDVAAAIAKAVDKKQKRKRKNSDGDSILKGGASPIKTKKKKKKDKNAPHKPLNGYVLFLNENRPRVIRDNPGLEFADVTKTLAAEWKILPDDRKQPYMQQAEQDRQRYAQELQQYKASGAFHTFQQSLLSANQKPEKQNRKSGGGEVMKKKPGPKPKQKTDSAATAVTAAQVPATSRAPAVTTVRSEESPSVTPELWHMPLKSEIPIFTEDFLEHNKVRETELRQLRKWTNEYEEQNAILSKHIEKMRGAVVRMEVEMNQMKEKNTAVEQTLNQLKTDFVTEFATRPIPGTTMFPTVANVEEYINLLLVSIEESGENKENKVTQEKVRKVMSKVLAAEDLQSGEKPLVATVSALNNNVSASSSSH